MLWCSIYLQRKINPTWNSQRSYIDVKVMGHMIKQSSQQFFRRLYHHSNNQSWSMTSCTITLTKSQTQAKFDKAKMLQLHVSTTQLSQQSSNQVDNITRLSCYKEVKKLLAGYLLTVASKRPWGFCSNRQITKIHVYLKTQIDLQWMNSTSQTDVSESPVRQVPQKQQ